MVPCIQVNTRSPSNVQWAPKELLYCNMHSADCMFRRGLVSDDQKFGPNRPRPRHCTHRVSEIDAEILVICWGL
jgi:hypothetical protein